MARLQNTLIGKAAGSIGSVTFTTWKGINVGKSKPVTVADPKTAGQLTQRSKLSKAVAFYRQITAILNLGYMMQAVGQSAYNAFISDNLKNGSFTGGTGNKVDVPANLAIAKGTLTAQVISAATVNTAKDNVAITWPTTLVGNQAATDVAYAIVTGADGTVLATSAGSVARSVGTLTLSWTGALANKSDAKTYLFFYQSSSRKVSDSDYCIGA